MRVLFTTYPQKTHFLMMAPLAWALRTAGHEVRIASQPTLTGDIVGAGLTAVPLGREHGFWRMHSVHPEWLAPTTMGLPWPFDTAIADPAAVTWDHLRDGFRFQVSRWHKMTNFPMVTDLVDFARHWRPDLVIWEPTTYAGAIAARACGAVHARLLFGLDVFGPARAQYLRLKNEQPPEDREDPLAGWLASYATKYGFAFDEDLVTGQFTIDQLPPSLRLESDLQYLTMRYTPYGGAATVPSWLQTPPERPRVALTLGLSTADHAVDPAQLLGALAELDIEVVATIANPPAQIPDNTRVVPYVPLHALVPTCVAVIHHAGASTLATTALHAVPQLIIPGDFDGPALARLAAAQGAALVLPADQAEGRNVRDGLLRLLTEPAFGTAAGRLRAEMRALPTPNELVGQLEELTAKHRDSC